MKNTTWRNDSELFSIMKKELYSAVIGDSMDRKNYIHQFLPPHIRPLKDDMVVVGRAFPVVEADIDSSAITGELSDKPFGVMLEALDDLKENEVYICTGSSPSYALWGEIMTTRAKILNASGAVLDGYSRDTHGILNADFPTFSYGSYSQDQQVRGKVVDYRVPIQIGKVVIRPGDIIFGDLDGVCVIPYEMEEEIILEAIEKAGEEKVVQKEILKGMSACEAFEKYGVI